MKNLIAFFEIPCIDFKRAVDFYETVLETKLSVSEWEKEKMACFMGKNEVTGSVSHAADFLPSENGVLIHFHCKNIENTLKTVIIKGGKIIIPKTKIQAEGKGYFTVFSDTEENHIGLYTD